MADILGWAVLILIVIAVALVGYFIVKNIAHLVINGILGLLALFILNYFHLMSYAGKPDIAISWVTVLICALGGIPGAFLLVILHLLGYSL
jgi:hypothetical protein